MENKQSKLIYTLFFLFLTIGFFACNKTDEDEIVKKAKVQVVYAIAGGPAVDVYIDNQKKNDTSLSYFKNTGYFEIDPANDLSVNYRLPKTVTTIASQFLNLRDRISYTLYLTGSVNGTDYSAIKTISSADTTATPASGKAKIRIVNAVASGQDIDFYKDGDTVITKLKNQAVNNFSVVDARETTFDIRLKGDKTVLTSTKMILETGKVYTFLARGVAGQNTGATAIMLTPIHNN